MTTELGVRRGDTADLGSLTRLSAEVHAMHVAERPDQFQPVDSRNLEESLLELIRSPITTVWVAELAGEVRGYAVVQRRERAESLWCQARTWWEIDQLGVAAAHRRSGVARALLERITAEAKDAGVSQVELCTWAFNTAAQQAFRELGFVPKVIRFELERT